MLRGACGEGLAAKGLHITASEDYEACLCQALADVAKEVHQPPPIFLQMLLQKDALKR
jgi:hypothetical protein